MVDDDDATVGERPDRMAHVCRDDGDNTGSRNMADAVDDDLELASQDFVDFLRGMEVFVDGGCAVEFVVRKVIVSELK